MSNKYEATFHPSDGPTDQGACEALVEQLAEAIGCALADVEPSWAINDRAHEALTRATTSAVAPLVAAQVEAAVSVVRAERDRAREEVRARDDDAALEVERVKRGARELGRILDQTLNMALDISGRQDVVDADGDGDWGLVWETLAELRPRAEAAEAEVERLTQIVARRTAHAEQAEADLQALREGLEAPAEEAAR